MFNIRHSITPENFFFNQSQQAKQVQKIQQNQQLQETQQIKQNQHVQQKNVQRKQNQMGQSEYNPQTSLSNQQSAEIYEEIEYPMKSSLSSNKINSLTIESDIFSKIRKSVTFALSSIRKSISSISFVRDASPAQSNIQESNSKEIILKIFLSI